VSDTSISSAPTSTSSEGRSQSLTQQGAEMKHQGKAQLREQVDQRTTQAGEQVKSFAHTLRRTGSELEGESGGENVNRVVSGVADRLERLGGYLEGARGDDLLRDGERIARERPWLVAGAAAAVGFTLSRLLKASSESRYEGNGSRSLQGSSWNDDLTRTGSESHSVERVAVGSGRAS
jgi:ElaB/YqjD/DUF883 family membrane-anchored ribosome-binding protein